MMTVAALIAVRMKSERLEKKSTKKIGSMMLIEHIIKRIKKAKLVDDIVLCTSTNPDDCVLISIAKRNGVKWFAGSEDDVLDRFINAAEMAGADVAVRVTGDNPLTDPEYMDRVIKRQSETGAEYVRTEGLPDGTASEVMTLAALKKAHEIAKNPEKSEYMTYYFTKSSAFRTEVVEADMDVRRPQYKLGVDTPDDLKLLKIIYNELCMNGEFTLAEVVKFLDNRPALSKSNLGVQGRKTSAKMQGGKILIEGG